MEIPDGNFRHIFLHYFRKSENAVQARKKLYNVYGEKSLTERQCQNCFVRFTSGDFNLKDAPRSGRPTEVENDNIKAMIKNNRRSTTREIAEKLNISHTCVERHLKQLGYVNKLDIWVPYKLNEIQLTKRISICDPLLKRNEIDPFLKRIITGDGKCVIYDNVVRKRSWNKRDKPAQSTLKADIHQKKVMLSVWWNFKGIVFFSCSQGTKLSIRMSTVAS